MKSTAFAKAIPGIILVLCVFSLAFWFSSSRRAGMVSERVPEPVPAAASGQTPATPITTVPGAPANVPGGTPLTTSSAEPPAVAGSWQQFRGANFDAINTETTPLSTKWAAGEPKIFWGIDVGEGYAAAAVANSRVYILDYDRTAQADVLKCLAFADAKELWRYSYPVAIKRNHGMSRTIPVVSGQYVVSLGPKCHVVCADAKTGKLFWMMDLVKQFGTVVPEWYAGQCPIIDGGKAIIAPGGSSLMIAVDCATGKIVWQTPNPDRWGMTHSSIAPMTLNSKKMYIYCSTGGVVGVDAANGSILWKTDAWKNKIANVPTPVVIGDGRIFLCSGYNLGAMMIRVKGQGGKFGVETLYSLKASVFGSDQQTPILYKGYIYGVRPGGQLVCLDLNGKVLWDSGAARFGIGPYTLAGGNIYIMNDSGVLTLAAANPSGYKQLAQAKILNGADSWGPMAIAGGRLIARNLTRMVCVDIGRR
ncbi:MAG: PQQ-like beta-propeller repeat protein [Armatimonadetes bacterium]|nr:PQQ-like beta-propeller repeat protein [Armatimonadota bacterium]